MQSRRRDFLATLGSAAAMPVVAFAQGPGGPQKLVAVIWALPENDSRIPGSIAAVLEGLTEQGWISGQNLRLVSRAGGFNREVARAHARELSSLHPDVFITAGVYVTEDVLPYRGSTPIVFFAVVDPVAAGLVQTLPRPAGNITGFTHVDPTLGGKWLELLHRIKPNLSHAVLLFNPQLDEAGMHYRYYVQSFQDAADTLGIVASTAPVSDQNDLAAAINNIATAPNGGVVVPSDAFLLILRREIVQAVARARVPAVYGYRDFVEEGGLMSYSADPAVWFRGVGAYAGRILNGERAAELPVQFPSVFQLYLNLRTAAELSLSIPASVLAIADVTIE